MPQVTEKQAGPSRRRELAAVALAEMRSARRLARTWLFGALALILGLLSYVYYSVLHGFASGFSGSIGVSNPRFLMSAIGGFLMWLFLVAMIFLAFDVRARDARERMAEVLDARPLDNLTMLTGRVLGLVVVVWVPLLLMALLMQGLGGLAVALDWPVGTPIEPNSLLAFVLVDAPVNLVLWGALVALLAVALRNRLAVVLVALALCGLQLYALYQVPAYLAPVLSGFAAFSQLASDVLPHFASAADLAQRVCVLLAAAGLVVLAAALHPRPDRSARAPRLGMGAGLLALGIGGIAALAWQAHDAVALRGAWLAHHQAHRDAPVATLDQVAGEVTIDAGANLELALDYTVAPPPGEDTLIFAFNPGMTVRELRVDDEAASFEHGHGLLQVRIPPAAKGQAKLQLSVAASGVPDPAFAYLDSAIDLDSASAGEGSALSLLGIDGSVFDDRYVALMPGAYWMPLPGVAVGSEQAERRGSDFFNVDLRVRTPEEWLAAGPGRREGENGEFRFRPAAPVPAVGILASRFERRATEVADVELELLMSPEHIRNLELFEEVVAPLAERLREMLAYAAEHGLPYPYKTLTAVEIPARLRVFGGDWRMDSVQALPGVVLLREYGFPTSRFEQRLQFPDLEDGEQKDRTQVQVLESFFHNDITGGDPLHGAARNFLGFQTSASGPGAVALDFVVHDLTVQLLTGSRRGFFSAHTLSSQQELQSLVMGSLGAFITRQSASIGGSAYMGATRKPSVWDTALAASLADLQPRADARRALEVLWLKGPEVAQAILDGIGRERAGALLAELRRRHRGGNYTLADFHAAGAVAGADLDALLGDWLHDAALPGYLVSPVRVARLTDDDLGLPRYQIAVDVRNDEPVPGLLRLSYAENTEAGYLFDASEPTRVPGNSAVELGMVAKALPERLSLASYLSLNRRPLQLPLPEVKDEPVDAAPFTGARPSEWRPPEDPAIVVDDLDAGFSVQDNAEDGGGFNAAMPWGMPEADIDQGLPVFSPFAPSFRWGRQEADAAWGKYRRTLARVGNGDGSAKATFTATLPTAGRWRLEYHLPALRSVSVQFGPGSVNARGRGQSLRGQGSYDMRLFAAGEERELEFDAGAGSPGWNRIGDYDLPAGETRLTVSNKTSGEAVLADAIRWVPLTQ